MGKKANRFEARYLHGNGGRICGRYKCEGYASYLGRSVIVPDFGLPMPRGIGMGWQKSADVIVALLPQSEGLNNDERE